MDIDYDFSSYGDEYEIEGETEQDYVTGSYLPNHLSSPITNDESLFLLEHKKFFCYRHKKLKDKIEGLKIKSHIFETCDDPYYCLKNYINDETIDYHYMKKCFNKIIKNALISNTIHQLNFNGNSLTKNDKDMIQCYNKQLLTEIIKYEKILFDHFLMMKKVETIKEKIALTRVKYGDLIQHRNLEIDRDLFVLNCKQHGHVIGPTNLVLCVLDIYQSRFSIILYSVLADITKKYNKYSLLPKIENLIYEIERIRPKMKNDCFKFLSLWESLIVGYTINDNINDLGFFELYDSTLKDMSELERKYDLKINLSYFLPQTRNKDEIKMFLELTGINKNFGHPVLDVCQGFDNVKKYGKEKITIDMEIARNTRAIFTRDFIKEYIHKKRRWPALSYIPSELKEFYNKNKFPSKKYNLQYKLWEMIKFDKIFDYDYSPDTSELLKDTAAAPELDQWFVPYDNCAFKILYNKPKPFLASEPKPTRVIERFLIGSEYETLKKVYEVDNKYFDKKDLIAILCRKEQELKPEGRLFVKQTYEQRLLQTSMENNIAKQVMKYIPEQTMTDGELQQMRRLSETATHQGELLEIFNLDLSKWNLRFRHALTYKIGEAIDEMFGLKSLYKNNHLWFIKSGVFINSRLCPPDYDEDKKPIPGKYYYTKHLGGMEGMRQKLWTIITITLIKLSAESLNLAIDIMCQGDNQVVMIRYKPHQLEIKEKIRHNFLNILENNLTKVNLKLKREETWFSTKLCEFGKIRYFQGEAVSAMLKKGARLIPDINDGVCSILSSLSTINTITEAMSKYDHNPDISFFINQFHILNFLLRKSIINFKESDEVWLQYLYHPTEFGGITLSTYFSHFVRGYDDKIPLWLSLFKTIKHHYPSLYKKVISINQLEPNPGNPNVQKLIEDIFSLNIKYLPSIEQTFKNLALNHLNSQQVTNPEIKKLFKDDFNTSNDYLIHTLSTMKPMILSVAHEILRNSNIGIILNLRNRFTNIQTINKIIQRKYKRDFLQMMKNNNNLLIKLLIKRKTNVESYYTQSFFRVSDCPTKLAEWLRKDHWKLDLLGDTKSYPCHQTLIKPVDFCSTKELENSIVIQLSNQYSIMKQCQYLLDGPFTAYLGSATKEKIKKPTLDISVKTSYTKSLQQLYLMKSWFQRLGCTNLITLTDFLISEKDDVSFDDEFDIDIEDWCATNYGGNILHRFKSLIERNTAVINFLPTVSSHFKQSTNYLASITSGGRDYTVHFQLILITNIARIIKLKELKYQGICQFASVLTCKECTKEITTVEFDIQDKVEIQSIQPAKLLQSIKAEHNYTNIEIQIAMSTYFGRLFGIIADTYFNKLYLDQKVSITIRSIPQLEIISINDFRYTLWSFLIIGLLQGSKNLRSIFLKLSKFELIFSKCKILEPLASYLVNSNLLQDFLKFTRYQCKEHSQILLPERVCEILLMAIYNYVASNIDLVCYRFLNTKFKEDNIDIKRSRIIWIIQLIKKIRDTINIQPKDLRIILFSKSVTLEEKQRLILNSLFYVENIDLPYRVNLIKENEVVSLFRKSSKTHLLKNLIKPEKIYPVLILKTTNNEMFNNYQSLFSTLIDSISQNLEFENIHHLTRQFGNISTGMTKIIEIINFFHLENVKLKRIICLAEGSGSIFEGLNILYPNCKNYYNTLLIPEIDMRIGVDQNYPPTIINSRNISINDFNKYNTLSLGETNIKKKQFKDKLKSILLTEEPTILTIDAESIEGTSNYDILKEYTEICSKSKLDIIIIKYFYLTTNIPVLNCPEYEIISFKPLTSHLNNKELYLIMLRKDIVNNNIQQSINNAKLLINYHHELFTKKTLSSIKSIYKFIDVTFWLCCELRRNFYNLPFPPDIFTELFSQGESCSIYCKNLKFYILNLIGTIDETSGEETEYFILFRDCGIIKLLERLTKLYYIIDIIQHYNSKEKFLIMLCDMYSVRVPRNFRDEINLFETEELKDCFDFKCVIRRLYRDELFCKCKKDITHNKISNLTRKLTTIRFKTLI